LPSWSASLITYCSSSTASKKRRGREGPLVSLPFCKEISSQGYHSRELRRSQRTKLDPIQPLVWKAKCSHHFQDFAKSSFRVTISFLLCWHWWIYSKHQAMQSWLFWTSWSHTDSHEEVELSLIAVCQQEFLWAA
jgi:hypothetical protein